MPYKLVSWNNKGHAIYKTKRKLYGKCERVRDAPWNVMNHVDTVILVKAHRTYIRI